MQRTILLVHGRRWRCVPEWFLNMSSHGEIDARLSFYSLSETELTYTDLSTHYIENLQLAMLLHAPAREHLPTADDRLLCLGGPPATPVRQLQAGC